MIFLGAGEAGILTKYSRRFRSKARKSTKILEASTAFCICILIRYSTFSQNWVFEKMFFWELEPQKWFNLFGGFPSYFWVFEKIVLYQDFSTSLIKFPKMGFEKWLIIFARTYCTSGLVQLIIFKKYSLETWSINNPAHWSSNIVVTSLIRYSLCSTLFSPATRGLLEIRVFFIKWYYLCWHSELFPGRITQRG